MMDVLKQFGRETVDKMTEITGLNGDDSLLNGPDSIVRTIINTVIGALAIIAVVVMIIGGITYMTSSGDAGKVKKAKDTILYGIIGLVVCALA